MVYNTVTALQEIVDPEKRTLGRRVPRRETPRCRTRQAGNRAFPARPGRGQCSPPKGRASMATDGRPQLPPNKLVLDDDLTDLRLAGCALTRAGHEVFSASNVSKVLEA